MFRNPQEQHQRQNNMFEDFTGILIYMISINEDCLCSNDLIYM